MLPFLSQPAVALACYVPRAPIEQSQLFNGSQTLTAAAALGGGTFACWIQRHALGAMTIVGGLAFDAADVLNGSTGKYRDLSGFSLVVANADGVYVDLVQVASGVASFGSVIGSGLKAAMAEVIFLSGDAHVLPTEFGALNIHGEPVPIATSFDAAEFGAKGFHLDFANPLAPGNDISGLGHHLTPSGFDGAGKDTVASSPTNVYATWNALVPGAVALSNGNTTAYYNASGANSLAVTSLFAWSGKYRAQVTIDTANMFIGVVGTSVGTSSAPSTQSPAVWYRSDSGQKIVNGVASLYGAAYVAPNVITIDLDLDGQTVEFSKNGVSQGVIALPVSGQPWAFACSQTGLAAWRATINCGQSSGYTAFPVYLPLCTENLPEPEVKDPAEGYAAETGTGADILTSLNASTDHWNGAAYVEIIKRRDAVESWRWRFSDDPTQVIASDNANAKAALPALEAGGFYVGHRLRVGKRYGVWTAEVTHTTGTPTTVTHGLATARNAVIATRVSAGGGDRYFRHPDMTVGHLMVLNGLAGSAPGTSITSFGADSFQIGGGATSGTYRVLVLAERAGLLALPTYTGNGLPDGAFGAADILPLWLWMFKSTNVGGRRMWDAVRNAVNPASIFSAFNEPAIEGTSYPLDFVVGGVKARTADNAVNGLDDKHHLVMWGRPIGGVCVAPATAR